MSRKRHIMTCSRVYCDSGALLIVLYSVMYCASVCGAVLSCVVLEKVKYEIEENKGSESSKSRRIREWDKGEG